MIASRFVTSFALVVLVASLPLAAVATEPSTAGTSPQPQAETVEDCYDESTGQFVSCEGSSGCYDSSGAAVPCEGTAPVCAEEKREYVADDGSYHYEYREECHASGGECHSSTGGSSGGEWYDANGNGKVDPGEHGETVAYDCPGPVRMSECADHHRDMETKAHAVQERQRQERHELDVAWQARHADVSRSNRTESEWAALHAEQEEDYRELSARHAREWQELSYVMASSACNEPAPALPACEASYRAKEATVYDEKVRAEMQRLHELLAERRLEFETKLRAEYDAFMASGPSDEEAERFAANMRDRFQAFELDQQAHLMEWKQRMAAEYGHYAERAGWACSGVAVERDEAKPLPATAPFHVRKHHSKYADWERQRLAFELELRIAYVDFLDAQNAALDEFLAGGPSDREVRAFEARQEAERLRFELDARDRMRDFESGLQAEWRHEVGDGLDDGPRHERFGSFSVAEDEATGRVVVTGKYVVFEGDPATQAIGPHTVKGQLLLDALYASVQLEDFGFGDGAGGTALHVGGDGLRMSLHDHPSGLMKFRTKHGATIQLDFADYLDVEKHGKGVRISADGVEGFLRASDEATLDEATNTVTFAGEGTFLLTSAPSPVLDNVANKHRQAVLDAVEAGDVAAEVTLVAGEDALEGEELEYGTVDVQVEHTDLAAKTASLLIESEEHAGKTIVVNLDKDGFGLGVELTFYELAEDGAASEAPIVKASSLADVLDASDDDTAEYWIVVDEDGTQVLVSIPHFSAKRLEIQGSASAATPNIVLVGALVGVGVIGVALVVWGATRSLPGSRKPPQ